MLTTPLVQSALIILASDPKAIGRLCDYFGQMPNIEMKTMGGLVWWEDLANVEGWRVQKNKLFGNCRILDPQDIRRAWGGEKAMVQAFEKLVESSSKEQA